MCFYCWLWISEWFLSINMGQMKSYFLMYYGTTTVWNVSKYGVFSGLYFPAFGLNTERYEVSLRIQSECGKIRTRKNSVVGLFSQSVRKSREMQNNTKFWDILKSFSDIYDEQFFENSFVIIFNYFCYKAPS